MAEKIDVLVVGGGMAGCSAAIAASRAGANVHLVEAANVLGGNATRAMVGPWQSFHASVINKDGTLPEQVIHGIAQEFIDDLYALDASPGHVVDPLGFAGSITPVDPQVLKLYLPAKLLEAGVSVSLSTPVTAEHLDIAAQIIDASGSAAAARLLNAETYSPDSPQPMSWLFTMQDVDTEAVRRYQLGFPDEFVLHPAFDRITHQFIAVSGFFSLVREARESGELDIPRDRLLFFGTPHENEVLVNTTRIPEGHPDPLTEGLRQINELSIWMVKNIPGFGAARLGVIADSIGQRESHRIVGKDTLSSETVISGSSSADVAARGSFPVDIHSPDNEALITDKVGGQGWYGIPRGCLESINVSKLLACGRCLSADKVGFASARVIPTAIATGEAAGLLAAKRALD